MIITRNYIPEPGDEYLNTGHGYLVIRAEFGDEEYPNHANPETIGDVPTLRVIEPEGFAWPTVKALFFVETDLPVGPLSFRQYAEEVMRNPRIGDWLKEAAYKQLQHLESVSQEAVGGVVDGRNWRI